MDFMPMTSKEFTKTNFPLGMVKEALKTKNGGAHKTHNGTGANLTKIQQNNFATHFSWGKANDYKGMSMTKTAFNKKS